MGLFVLFEFSFIFGGRKVFVLLFFCRGFYGWLGVFWVLRGRGFVYCIFEEKGRRERFEGGDSLGKFFWRLEEG